MKSLIYSNRLLYNGIMRFLYLGSYEKRYKRISEEISQEDSILELCFGDLHLFKHYLQPKGIEYIGIDINEIFVRYSKKIGANCYLGDVRSIAFPKADIVLIQDSLYHFIENDIGFLQKMFDAARKKIIICEPVRNLAQSSNKIISFFGKNFVDAGTGSNESRYNLQSLKILRNNFIEINHMDVSYSSFEDLGRDAIFIISKT